MNEQHRKPTKDGFLLQPPDRVLLGAALDFVTSTTLAVLGQSGAEDEWCVRDAEYETTEPAEITAATRAACALCLKLRHQIEGEACANAAWAHLWRATDALSDLMEPGVPETDYERSALHGARRKIISALAELRLHRVV